MSKSHCDPEFIEDPFYDPDLARAEALGWQAAEMERLARHLDAGKTISSPDLAKILRVTLDAEIPKAVRLVIATLLEKKTGRGRKCTYFKATGNMFRDATIRRAYKELRAQSLSPENAKQELKKRFFLEVATIEDILKKGSG